MLIYLQTLDSPTDRARFEELYLAYRGLMYHVAYEILKNKQDAEDAVHQSFVKIADHMADIPDGPCPRTRVLAATITERTAIDCYRAKRRHPEVDLEELSLGTEQPQPDGTLAGAMAALPPKYREVLLLRFYSGYEYSEIAAFLGTTAENVRQRAARAKKKLAAELAERGEPV